jgi:hypothetical protein
MNIHSSERKKNIIKTKSSLNILMIIIENPCRNLNLFLINKLSVKNKTIYSLISCAFALIINHAFFI